MTGKAGVKLFGKKAIEALVEEMVQFLDLEVFEGIMPEALTKEQKKSALYAISLIKLKRDFRLKGRIVADGRMQRRLYS